MRTAVALKDAAFRIFSLKVQFPLCNSATHWTVRGGTRNQVSGSQPCRSTTENTHGNHGYCTCITESPSQLPGGWTESADHEAPPQPPTQTCRAALPRSAPPQLQCPSTICNLTLTREAPTFRGENLCSGAAEADRREAAPLQQEVTH